MNTVQIGNDFEEKSYYIIEKAIKNNDLGLIPDYCRVFRKKGYYSFRRKKDIIFDLAIEFTPPKAENPALLYLIECKKYSNSVPVDDIATFAEYMGQIEGFATKGIFITNNKLQKGALETLKSYGIMLIEVNDDDYNIILNRKDRLGNKNAKELDLDEKLRLTIENAILPQKVEGLKRLSEKQIQNIADNFLNEYDRSILENASYLDLNKLKEYLNEKYGLTVEYVNLLDHDNSKLLGYFDTEKNKILIDYSVLGSERYPFTLAHEIGHFVLHKDLKMNQTVYNNFKDSSHNIFTQKNSLENDKNWIEWQANYFASSILMPHISLVAQLIGIQRQMGVSRNQGTIYLDHQEQNRKDFYTYLDYLSEHFKVSKLSIEYRLKNLGILLYPKDVKPDYENEQERIRQESIRRAKNFMNRKY